MGQKKLLNINFILTFNYATPLLLSKVLIKFMKICTNCVKKIKIIYHYVTKIVLRLRFKFISNISNVIIASILWQVVYVCIITIFYVWLGYHFHLFLEDLAVINLPMEHSHLPRRQINIEGVEYYLDVARRPSGPVNLICLHNSNTNSQLFHIVEGTHLPRFVNSNPDFTFLPQVYEQPCSNITLLTPNKQYNIPVANVSYEVDQTINQLYQGKQNWVKSLQISILMNFAVTADEIVLFTFLAVISGPYIFPAMLQAYFIR